MDVELFQSASRAAIVSKPSGAAPQGGHAKAPGPGHRLQNQGVGAAPALDLRPDFVKKGLLVPQGSGDVAGVDSSPDPSGIQNGTSRDLLFTESRVFEVFDRLAERINLRLEYPMMLVENGIEGTATLDLYFDHDGNVDEAKSKCFGDNRAVRGLLVKATRTGLVEWLLNDAHRIEKCQFRDQHFRADFVITHATTDLSEMIKNEASRSYRYVRRRAFNGMCIAGTPSGAPFLNLACVAAKVAGTLKRSVSETYKTQFYALQDNLERYDQIGLDGVNELARKNA